MEILGPVAAAATVVGTVIAWLTYTAQQRNASSQINEVTYEPARMQDDDFRISQGEELRRETRICLTVVLVAYPILLVPLGGIIAIFMALAARRGAARVPPGYSFSHTARFVKGAATVNMLLCVLNVIAWLDEFRRNGILENIF